MLACRINSRWTPIWRFRLIEPAAEAVPERFPADFAVDARRLGRRPNMLLLNFLLMVRLLRRRTGEQPTLRRRIAAIPIRQELVGEFRRNRHEIA